LIAHISWRHIAGEDYVYADVGYLYFESMHANFMGFLILPVFFMWAILFPFVVAVLLVDNKESLFTHILVRFRLGVTLYHMVVPLQGLPIVNLRMGTHENVRENHHRLSTQPVQLIASVPLWNHIDCAHRVLHCFLLHETLLQRKPEQSGPLSNERVYCTNPLRYSAAVTRH
jgi:hypothetical protein